MQIAKKITLGGINGVRAGFKNVKELTLVARIMGLASGAEAKDSTMGTSYKFTGEFRAINADGEETAAPVCYLPPPADGLLLEAVKTAGGQPVRFGFDFYVSPNPSAVLGYEYKIKPLMETKPSDALAEMMSAAPAIALTPKQAPLLGNETAPSANVEQAPAGSAEKATETAAPDAKATGKKK